LGLSWLDLRRPGPRTGRPRAGELIVWFALSAGLGVAIGAIGQTRLEPPRARELSSTPSRPAARSSPATDGVAGERSDPAGGVAQPGVALLTEGVSGQVLNASGAGRADNAMGTRLERLGYRVAALNPAAVRYAKTTVFWSRPGGRRAAEALARRFGWRAAPKPRNLSASVTIHVVVGRDEAR